MSRAGVYSIAALDDFRAALCSFAAEARQALVAVDLEAARMLEWIQDHQVKHWRSEHRRRQEAVTNAKADLDRARISAMFGRPADCIDQKRALQRAKLRLEEAEEKIKAVKQWGRLIEQELAEFKGPFQQLDTTLSVAVPRAAAELDRLIAALEAYAAAPPPVAAGASGEGVKGGWGEEDEDDKETRGQGDKGNTRGVGRGLGHADALPPGTHGGEEEDHATRGHGDTGNAGGDGRRLGHADALPPGIHGGTTSGQGDKEKRRSSS